MSVCLFYSQFSDMEREHLVRFSRGLGATYVDLYPFLPLSLVLPLSPSSPSPRPPPLPHPLIIQCMFIYTCRVQDHFARYPAHGLLATTHLVLKHPSGEKLSFAVKWGIPAVSDRCVCVCGKEEGWWEGGLFNVLVRYLYGVPSLFPPSSLLPAVGYLLVQQPRRLFQLRTIS